MQVPLRVYSADGALIAEIGEQRRVPVAIDEVPEKLKQAFLAAEDDRFYRHPGIDWRGTTRGAWGYLRSLGKGRVPGGSTITQQVARRFFLSSEYSVTRKLREILLAIKIERELSKDEIFELYLNKEFLGHRAYGVGAAGRVYYGKTLDQLTLAESAMISALPKTPSRVNPITDPERALVRRDWVLGRMRDLGYISHADWRAAVNEPDQAAYHGPVIELNAPWIAEIARQEAADRLGAQEAYTGGYRLVTTVDSRLQRAAEAAVHNGLADYDRRHGWRGPEGTLDMDLLGDRGQLEAELQSIRPVADMVPAVVLEANADTARLLVRESGEIELTVEQVAWARRHLARDALGPRPDAVEQVLAPADLVRVRRTGDGWELAQVPEAEAALVAMDPGSGAVVAIVGGLDFDRSQFNRVTQSRRQPGSAFKPFIYAAALDYGYTPASLVNDAPVVLDDPSMERVWKPTNFSQRFYGPTRLREAMIHSRNLVSVRLLMGMGVEFARDYIEEFGFERAQLPAGPSMALGSASISPLSLTAAYAVFANGGFAVRPQFLHAISDLNGRIVFEPEWTVLCADCPPPRSPRLDLEEALVERRDDPGPAVRRPGTTQGRSAANADDFTGPPLPRYAEQVLRPQTTWLIRSMLADVVRLGTGRRALELNRSDLAGKTGTSNDFRDTWFTGFNDHLVATVWLGRDDHENLGREEQGGRTALPLWVEFMTEALRDVPEDGSRPLPVGLVRARIDPETGLRARPGNPRSIEEWFHADNLPPLEPADGERMNRQAEEDPYEIF